MKIFIGADKYGADFEALDILRKKSERQGFTGFRNWVNLKEELGDFSLQGRRAIIRGGYTGICVAHAAEFLLDNQVTEVIIDLPNCRYDEKDTKSESLDLERRREDVLLGMNRHRDNKRVVFTR